MLTFGICAVQAQSTWPEDLYFGLKKIKHYATSGIFPINSSNSWNFRSNKWSFYFPLFLRNKIFLEKDKEDYYNSSIKFHLICLLKLKIWISQSLQLKMLYASLESQKNFHRKKFYKCTIVKKLSIHYYNSRNI